MQGRPPRRRNADARACASRGRGRRQEVRDSRTRQNLDANRRRSGCVPGRQKDYEPTGDRRVQDGNRRQEHQSLISSFTDQAARHDVAYSGNVSNSTWRAQTPVEQCWILIVAESIVRSRSRPDRVVQVGHGLPLWLRSQHSRCTSDSCRLPALHRSAALGHFRTLALQKSGSPSPRPTDLMVASSGSTPKRHSSRSTKGSLQGCPGRATEIHNS
jgi:hypothetical protein